MTLAVCFSCGLDKPGPLARCGHCGATPRSGHELSLSLILCRQLSADSQLAQFAQQIQSGRGVQIPESLLIKVQEALKDPRLAAMLRVGKRMGELDGAPPASRVTVSAHPSRPAHPPHPVGKETTLHRNAFWLLGATVRDNRRRLVELAEERALEHNADACQKARADLTNPRRRLGAELAWLPGVSPARAAQLAQRLLGDPLSLREEPGLPPLAQANLMAALLEATGADDQAEAVAGFILEVARLVDELSVDSVMRDINEDRAVAGFPAVESTDEVEAGLTERKRHFRDAAKSTLEELPSSSLVDVMTRVVEEATAGGEDPAPELIDLLVDSYEIETQNVLEKEAESLRRLIGATRKTAEQGEEAVTPLLDQLEAVVRNWDKIAQPIQLGFKVRGTRHQPSMELAHEIRDLGVDLFNDNDMATPALRLTVLLQELFAELPEVVERANEDADTLDNILRNKAESEINKEEWEREITYNVKIGAFLTRTLGISPDGVVWGNQVYPLEAITSVRWGGVRRSAFHVDYTMGFGDERSQANVIVSQQDVFLTFIEKLMLAVGPRLLFELLQSLKAGKELQFADARILDDGAILPKRKAWGSREMRKYSWNEIHIWDADGAFFIGAKADNKAYAGLSYIHCPNAHILERAIRIAFNRPGIRVLSDLLDSR